ncbi:MAG: metallophosphatase [Bacteroidetes bacterium 46-16]|nr:MAG: metallophosphatase [Bacteroidetes bacterium 46-16]
MWLRVLIILAVVGLAEYYSYIVVRSALRSLPQVWRTALMVTYILLTVFLWLSVIFFRQIDWAKLPHMARNIYIAFSLGFAIGKVLVLLVMLVDDLRRLVVWLVSLAMPAKEVAGDTGQVRGMSRSAFFSTLALILGGTSLLGFIYGVSNRYNYRVRRLQLKFPSLPAAFKGLKIVQVSDIHTGSFDNHDAVAKGIQRILDEKPDVIFFTGDLVNNEADEVDGRYQEIYARLNAPMGVYSILGNHDYGDYKHWPSKEAKKENLDRLKQMQGGMGWKLLLNEHVVLQRGNDKIAVIGVENWSAKGFHTYGDMAKAYEGLGEQEIPFKILLSHDPSHWDAQVRPKYGDVQLTLSGHTHGMQFGIEIPGFKWSPVQYMYKEWAGLYREGDQHLYVNRGFGFLGYPGRLGILPEITVMELV